MYWLAVLIIFFGIINLLRMTMFIIGSDLYELKMSNRIKKRYPYTPFFTVIIPAHNEQSTLLRAVHSIIHNHYPQKKLQVIVIDDGSTDDSKAFVKSYRRHYRLPNIEVITQQNSGKAHALNHALRYAKGKLIMCLDADSYLQPNSLKHAAAYFKDPQVVALSANVKIIDHPGLLNLVQKYEYLICYQMKRAQTLFNIEYIIGGIGSTFRKKVLDSINGYDGNTVTEDIDLTMKILQGGNKTQKVIYGADVIAMTESVLSIPSLIRQRFRWKWGRSQTFLKNKNLFFNSDHRFSKALTFFYLPFAIFGDFAFLFEPLMLFYIIFVSARFHDLQTFISACAVISGYIIVNISLENSLTTKEKLKLITVAPLMYLLFYILSFVEYVALIKSLIKLPQLRQSLSLQKCNWDHVERFKSKTAIS